MVAFWLEVNHSFRDASSPFYLRYLTLVPATLIIYAGPLFNVINVSSACSTNTDNFLSLQSPQHLHRKAEDSYRRSHSISCLRRLWPRYFIWQCIQPLNGPGIGDESGTVDFFSSQLYLLPVTQRKCQKGSDWFSFVGGGVGGLYWWFARNPIPEISVGRIAQEH